MRSFTLRRGRGNFTVFLILLFVLCAAGTFAYLQKTDKLTEFRINMFSSIGSDEIVFEDIEIAEEEQDLFIGVTEEGVQKEEIEEFKEIKQEYKPVLVFSSDEKTYEETAKEGEGITNLVRRAVKRYSEENNIEITSEHKVFVEDYIQNHIGDRVLQVGETVEITEDLIAEGMNKSQGLTESELEHLENFSELVWTSGFGTPRGL